MEQTPVTTFRISRKRKANLYLTAVGCGIAGPLLLWYSRSLMFGSGRAFFLLVGGVLTIIAFFCIMGIRFLSKEKDAAIYISEDGIMDISTGNSIGTIQWKDVEDIKVTDDISNLKQKYLVLKVRNPEDYIARERNGSKRRSLELRFQYYGSPICISARALDCSFEELKEAVMHRYTVYRNSNNS